MNSDGTIDFKRAISKTSDGPVASLVLAHIPGETRGSLLRMFADPYLLEKEERAHLVNELHACVAAEPEVSELRVLLGMALCVNFEVPEAIEQLRESVRLAPDSYIAHLKCGELWMRLRICDKAEEHTRQAALLARSAVQSELARRQAAAIRDLVRKGIRRGGQGSRGTWHWVASVRKLLKGDRSDAMEERSGAAGGYPEPPFLRPSANLAVIDHEGREHF